MRRIIYTLLFFVITAECLCQEINVFKMIPTQAIQAMTHRRDDIKGNACALLKVQFPVNNVHFGGNIVGEVVFKTNEYWVYMPSGEKEIRVFHEGIDSISIHFSDYGVAELEPKITYELTLFEKRKDAPQLYNEGMIAWAENDIAKAYCCLKTAAENGYTYAYYSLSRLFDLQDFEDSFQKEIAILSSNYLDKFNKNGNEDSIAHKDENMPIILSKEDIRNKGLKFEEEGQYEKAIYWYQRGDEKGDCVSQYCLGRMYDLGLGLGRNYAQAAELFKKASCSLDDFYGIMNCLGYSGNGGGFYGSFGAKFEDKYRSLSMAALAYMYMKGILTTNKNEKELYSLLSGTDIGLNIIGLNFFQNKDYAKARKFINIQHIPDKAIIDSTFVGDVYFALGMIDYWGLGGIDEFISLGKSYIKESAKLGNKKAQRIVNSTFIGNILPNGTITGKRIRQNGREGVIRLGMIRDDGTILYESEIGGKIDSNGVFWNSNNVKQGYIDGKGDIYGNVLRAEKKIGFVDKTGNVYDNSGNLLGSVSGLPIKYSLLYFFFDDVCKIQFTEFQPDME